MFFEKIGNAISNIFTFIIVAFVAYIAFIIIKAVINHLKDMERDRKEEEERKALINQIISDSKRFSTSVLISQRNDVQQAYSELYACRQRGSTKRKELLLFFRVGDELGCSMDLETCQAALQVLDDEIQRRKS